MGKIVHCVPNFSEGRNEEVIEKIVDSFRNIEGVTLLNYSPDKDHNRTVVNVMGDPAKVKDAMVAAAKAATELIDMSKHEGAHPRMGAVDVVPFIPVAEVTMEECVEYAKEVGERIGALGVPVYLYEEAASKPERKNLADVRKGQYEGFFEKITQEGWKPDFGPGEMNAKTGCTAVGARIALVAFNVNLNTDKLEIADAIAKKVRFIGGGLRFVKAMGVMLEDRNQVQVSMNLVNYKKTSIYRAIELIKAEAARYGVTVYGTELVGMVPLEALVESAEYYMQLEDFDVNQIIEKQLLNSK
ncbi:glutamate formimidoyltransferase [Filifactor villosus]|uniref:glutamate formimidoyltransferase n=1 Tax=Filifactor villosus TaxID=29374 RepID=A0ABV9QID1_9FIRM|nr:glutamate formimidoyltransferase [Filifactor alocis]